MSNVPPPPTYDEQRTQLLISPVSGTAQFQKGYLGVHGEHAAIEGEVQIKGSEPGQWDSATIILKSLEQSSTESIEIYTRTVVLFSGSTSGSLSAAHVIPSTLPFSIPLPADMPQCIHTSHSSISHRLTATLHPCNPSHNALTKSIPVHTRRYTSRHDAQLPTRPYIIGKEQPVPIKVELPRTSFLISEPIPIYITIPPPDVAIVRDQGFQLRNVMVELRRVIHFDYDNDSQSSLDLDSLVSRTGSSCRFHKSRPVQIRLVVYPHDSARYSNSLSSHENEGIRGEDLDCASITQTTLFHNVAFRLNIMVTFMLASTYSESVCSIDIPIQLLPSAASLPEVDESVTVAYYKKHDKPPDRTVRREDADFHHNEAGPSGMSPSFAPPPFDDRDAPPPPFFVADPAPSTSSRLPTFLESESEGHFPFYMEDDENSLTRSLRHLSIQGEGREFGFKLDEQFDGMSSSFEGSPEAPPSIAEARHDTDVTQLANIMMQPERALEALAMALEPSPSMVNLEEADHLAPPPPPPLDDPSDPPPSIDVEEFRRPPPSALELERSPPLRATPLDGTHAPPPYLQPTDGSQSEEGVMNPPPYVDFLPASNDRTS